MTTTPTGALDPDADARLATVPEIGSGAAPRTASAGAAGGPERLVSPRYAIGEEIGTGATSYVLAAHDRALDRQVALKVLSASNGPAAAHFLREARITAAIDHPNVVAVYDLEFVTDGTACIVMRRVAGRSLGDALRSGDAGDLNQLITIILKVGDALARAHDRGIIHQDIKPDNIMLGRFGEVIVLDWGEARLLGEDREPVAASAGTPAFMSPEQARAQQADERSDLYCLAATAWLAVTGQFPIWDEDPERFWQAKRRGVLDPLPAAVERRLPRRLLAVLRKGLAADPAERYQRVGDLAGDLVRFQAGQAVSAYRDGILERTLAFIRKHRRALATASLIALAFAGAATWVASERQRELSSWGAPVVNEDFRDDGWKTRWQVPPGSAWVREDSRLVSTSPAAADLVLGRRLTGSVAIEYDAQLLPGHHGCDLSVKWSERDPPASGEPVDIAHDVRRSYLVQAGAWCNYFSAIVQRTGDSEGRVAIARRRLQEGRWYHIRVELEGRDVRMYIDGDLELSYQDLLPHADGYLSLYGYYPGKAFAHVRVWQKRLPELVPAIALGDEALRRGQYEQAALEYQRCADSFPVTAMGAEAAFKRGLAIESAGRRDLALRAWAAVPPGDWRALVDEAQLDELWQRGQVGKALAEFAGLYRRAQPFQARLRRHWQHWAGSLPEARAARLACSRSLLDTRSACFGDDASTEEVAARLLNQLEGPAAVLAHFPDEPFQVVQALQDLGRDEEVLRRFPDFEDSCLSRSLMGLGRHDEASARTSDPATVAQALVLAGRAAEARSRFPGQLVGWLHGEDVDASLRHADSFPETIGALLCAGRYGEAGRLLQTFPPDHWPEDRLRVGLFDGSHPAAADPEAEPDVALAWLVVRRLEEGHGDKAVLARQALLKRFHRWSEPCTWFWFWVVPHLPELAAGDSRPLRAALADLADRHRTEQAGQAALLAARALGRIDDAAVLAQPTRSEAPAWLAIAQALEAELALQRGRAAACWAAYRALPPSQRLLRISQPDEVVERLAQWRAAP